MFFDKYKYLILEGDFPEFLRVLYYHCSNLNTSIIQ